MEVGVAVTLDSLPVWVTTESPTLTSEIATHPVEVNTLESGESMHKHSVAPSRGVQGRLSGVNGLFSSSRRHPLQDSASGLTTQ